MRVLNIMVLSGGIPDSITYNMLIGALCCKGHIGTAVSVLDGISVSGCTPDVIAYNAIMRRFIHA